MDLISDDSFEINLIELSFMYLASVYRYFLVMPTAINAPGQGYRPEGGKARMRSERLPVNDDDISVFSELLLTLSRSALNNLSLDTRPPDLELALPVLLERIGADNEGRKDFLALIL